MIDGGDDPERADDSLEQIVPANFKKSYDMHQVIECIIDRHSFLEVLPRFAANIIVGFARMEGATVGIVPTSRASRPAAWTWTPPTRRRGSSASATVSTFP